MSEGIIRCWTLLWISSQEFLHEVDPFRPQLGREAVRLEVLVITAVSLENGFVREWYGSSHELDHNAA